MEGQLLPSHEREIQAQREIRKKARGFQWVGTLVFATVLAITLDPTSNVDLSREVGQVGSVYLETIRNVAIIGAVSVNLALECVKYSAKKKIREIIKSLKTQTQAIS